MLCGLLIGFDTILTEINNTKKSFFVKRQNDHISLSIKVRPQALRIKNQFKKFIFISLYEIFEKFRKNRLYEKI